MKGSVFLRKDRSQWAIAWYWQGKRFVINRYKGRMMNQTHPDKRRDQGYIDACRLLAQMQGDVESGVFRVEKYTGKAYTDVIPFFEQWLDIKQKKKPATIKGYRSYFKNWIQPFFEANPVQLHEIQLDTLDKLLDFIKLSSKGKHNVMMCFHAFMDYAWRSRRIFEMPPFPKKEDYGLVVPSIKWLPENRQMEIIEAIPEEHRPIFLFLKYHLRRPSEACALQIEDYDVFNGIFIIRRSISARTLVNSTKTGTEHIIPCHSYFRETADRLSRQSGKFFFQNPRARLDGKRYSNESLNVIWKAACQKVGESIDLYSGLKHSSCSQFINEKGLSLSDLQTITDHARIESVKRYAKTEVARKRELMEMENRNPADKIRVIK